MLKGVAGTGGGVSTTGFCLEGVVALDDVIDCVLTRGVEGVVGVARIVDCVRTRWVLALSTDNLACKGVTALDGPLGVDVDLVFVLD